MCLYMCSKQDYDYFVARNYFHPSFLSQSQKWGWLFAKMSTQERLNLDPVNIFTSSVQPKIIQSNWPLQSKLSASIFFFFFFLHAAIHTFTSCYIFGICNSLCDFLAPTVYWWDLCLGQSAHFLAYCTQLWCGSLQPVTLHSLSAMPSAGDGNPKITKKRHQKTCHLVFTKN